MTSLTEQLAGWASALRLDDVPPRVVALATSQVLSQLAAIRAGASLPLGQALMRAFGPRSSPIPGGAPACSRGSARG